MFSKSRPSNEASQRQEPQRERPYEAPPQPQPQPEASQSETKPSEEQKPKAGPSVLSQDLTIKGNIQTSGDVQVEGQIEGDIRAHVLTVGETATVRGEVVADDVVVNGRIVGRVRGLKVRLTATSRVEGDIIHKTIAIESGAHFEGSVQRKDDPITGSGSGAERRAQPPGQPAKEGAD